MQIKVYICKLALSACLCVCRWWSWSDTADEWDDGWQWPGPASQWQSEPQSQGRQLYLTDLHCAISVIYLEFVFFVCQQLFSVVLLIVVGHMQPLGDCVE